MLDTVLSCTGCGREYPLGTKRCACGKGILRVVLDKPHATTSLPTSNVPGIWRYKAFLPRVSHQVSFYEGDTPLISSTRLGQELGISLLYKDETRNPTGSFKDRGAAMMISTAKDLGVKNVVTASSGNAAGAISLYSALAGIRAFIFMFQPSQQKLVQTLSYGATVLVVETTSEARVLELAEEAANAFGWALLNTTAAANPFVTEGYKTISYELYEQGDIPDWIAIPVASGSLLIGIWQGFRELEEVGLVKNIPRLLGVQPGGAAPIALAFASGEKTVRAIKEPNTIATALSLGDPGVSGTETLRAVRESNGAMLTIDDDKLMRIARDLPRRDGIFGEASGVISVAGVIYAKQQGIISNGERVTCIVTGSGLKDPSVFHQAAAPELFLVSDSMDSITSVLEKHNLLS